MFKNIKKILTNISKKIQKISNTFPKNVKKYIKKKCRLRFYMKKNHCNGKTLIFDTYTYMCDI